MGEGMEMLLPVPGDDPTPTNPSRFFVSALVSFSFCLLQL
jgi:hypothetical protein